MQRRDYSRALREVRDLPEDIGRLISQYKTLAAGLWPGLLCHRDDGCVHGQVGPRAVWGRGVSTFAPPGGPDDCGRHGDKEDGPASRAAL